MRVCSSFPMRWRVARKYRHRAQLEDSSYVMHEGTSPETARPTSPHAPRARWYAWIAGGCIGLCILLVIGCALLGGAITGLIYTFANQKEATATASQTLVVGGTPTLDVTNTAGSITVERGRADEVKVVYTKRAHDISQSDARRALNAIAVTINQAGNTITVNVTSPNTASMEAFRSQHTVDITLTVPSTSNLQLQLMAGHLDVRDVSGTLASSVQAGNINLTGVSFVGNNSVRVGAGNVTVDGALQVGSTLDVRVATGNTDVTLPPNAATHIVAVTSVGNVTIAGWSITPIHSGTGATATGDTTLKPTSTLTIHADTGRINVLANG